MFMQIRDSLNCFDADESGPACYLTTMCKRMNQSDSPGLDFSPAVPVRSRSHRLKFGVPSLLLLLPCHLLEVRLSPREIGFADNVHATLLAVASPPAIPFLFCTIIFFLFVLVVFVILQPPGGKGNGSWATVD